MSLIEKLDSVLEILNHSDAFFDEMFDAAKELLRDHGPAIRQDMIDAERWRAFRSAVVNSDSPAAKFLSQQDRPTSEDEADSQIDKARATGEGEGNG